MFSSCLSYLQLCLRCRLPFAVTGRERRRGDHQLVGTQEVPDGHRPCQPPSEAQSYHKDWQLGNAEAPKENVSFIKTKKKKSKLLFVNIYRLHIHCRLFVCCVYTKKCPHCGTNKGYPSFFTLIFLKINKSKCSYFWQALKGWFCRDDTVGSAHWLHHWRQNHKSSNTEETTFRSISTSIHWDFPNTASQLWQIMTDYVLLSNQEVAHQEVTASKTSRGAKTLHSGNLLLSLL